MAPPSHSVKTSDSFAVPAADLSEPPQAHSHPTEPDGFELLLQRGIDMTAPAVESVSSPAMDDTTEVTHIDRAAQPSRHSRRHQPSSDDSAELADLVYERIERRLRTELFRDLERRGHLSEWG